MSETYELAVIGAGPAGIEAAIAAANAGVQTVIIDNCPQAGGQYFKAIPPVFKVSKKTQTEIEGENLSKELDSLPITRFFNTLIWGIFKDEGEQDWLITLYGIDAPKQIRAQNLILANGAFDMPVAFPGWTLPGVITCGASLILVKTQRVAPGSRALVTGTGPLLLSAAAHLIEADVDVVAVCETSRLLPKGFRYIPTMLGQWHRIMEGANYFTTITRHRTPYKTGWSIVEARGDDQVEEAVIAKVDNAGVPIAGTEQTVKVDTIVCGYGLTPNTEFAGMIGCELEYQSLKGGWVPARDDSLQTSIPGVFAVGDGAGIGGAENSRLEGKLAGYTIALQTGHLNIDNVSGTYQQIKAKLARQRGFGRLLGDLFGLKPGLISLPHDDTHVCRCEEIRKKEIMAAIESGCDTVTWVKRMTRAGMGMCQGRTCGRIVARMIAQETGKDLSELSPDTVRPPLRPVPLGQLDQDN